MATAAEEIDVDGVAVRITNRGKVFFPKLGTQGTKGALIDYYRVVASGPMLTALRDRPTLLQRFPDGIDGEQIYQKRVPEKHPDYLKTTHPSAIVWAAQTGAITLHPWQVRCPDTDHPDELRIDLDPQPGTGFAEARTIAVDVLKPLLDELCLVGYPKTSGGRGVHVFLRIATDWDFVEVRRAAPHDDGDGLSPTRSTRASMRTPTSPVSVSTWTQSTMTGGRSLPRRSSMDGAAPRFG